MPDDERYTKALNKAMAQCSRRELCCEDIRKKLELLGIGKNDTERIIATLVKENFINEPRYATAFVKDRFNYNKWGKIKIGLYLKIKKIPADIISPALDSIDHDVYMRVLKDIISVHRKVVKTKNQYDLKAKLLRYGLSKGFESNLLYDLLNDLGD